MKQCVASLLLITFVSVSGVAGFVHAQTPAEVRFKEIVVTATRDWAEERRVPYNVNVITQDDIATRNAQHVVDVLRTVPGLVVSDLTANGKSVQVDIRGFGEAASANTLVLIDGRRANQVDLSGTEWVQIPLDQIERIEVMRGGGSVLYGDNAVGGVVNIVTKKGKGKPSVQGEVVLGSYEMNSERISSSGTVGKTRYSVNVRHQDTEGFRDNGFYEGKDVGASVGWDLSDTIALDLSGNYHEDHYGLPGALSEIDLATMNRDDTKNPNDKGSTRDWYVRTQGTVDLRSWGRVILDTSYRTRHAESRLFSAFGTYTLDSDIPTLGITSRWVWNQAVGPLDNRVTLGVDYYRTDSDQSSRSAFGATDAEITRDTIGAYFNDESAVANHVTVSFGYRHERLTNEFKGTGGGPVFREDNDETVNAWEAGVTYLFRNDSKIYGRVATSYRYPLIDEYFSVYSGLNTILDVQKGITYEAGLDIGLVPTVRVGFSVFQTDLDDEIFFNPLTFTNENYDETRRRGIEVSGHWLPLNWLRLWGAYTYLNAEFRDGPFRGNNVPMVPEQKTSGGIEITPLAGLLLHVWADYVGERYLVSDQANQAERLDDYTTINAKISYTWRMLTAFIGANNLFDKEYSEYGVVSGFTGLRNFYPSPGINFLGGLSLRL